jgi:replicative DNA helicase
MTETTNQPVHRARISAGLPAPHMIDRLPPMSIEAEQGFLGTLLLDPKFVFGEIADGNVSPFFYDLRHQVIFESIFALHEAGKPIDLITVGDVLKSNNQLEPCGGFTYLSALPDGCPSAANAKYYIEILEEKYALREIIRIGTETVRDAYEAEKSNPQAVIDAVSKQISTLAIKFNGQKILNIRELVHSCMEEYERFGKGENTNGIKTGFADYDEMTGGLKPSEYIVIAARPNIGKTAIAMNIAEHIAVNQKIPVAVFSLEMKAKDLVDRMICSRARVDRKSIRDGTIAEADYPKIVNAAGTIATSPIYIDDSGGLDLFQIRARTKKMRQDYGIQLVIIDYLQLLTPPSTNRYENRNSEVSRISAGLKSLLKELDIAGIIISQLNRDLEKDKKKRKPRLSDLRESGAIEQDADTIGMLYESDEEDEEDERKSVVPVSLIIRKQRNGPKGEVKLTFFKTFTRFESATKTSDVSF